MAKLTDGIGGSAAIGREGLVKFCNDMNEEKARIRSRARFFITDQNGKWTMERYQLHAGSDLSWFAYVEGPAPRLPA